MRGDDHAFAADLASSAGQVLVDLRSDYLRSRRITGRALAKAGDKAAQEYIAGRLLAERPDDAVLSEEAADDRTRLACDRVWIIDPLDGTREFSEDREDWAVHVALWQEGRLTAGAVSLPAHGSTMWTGASAEPPGRAREPIRLVVSRSRASDTVLAVAERIGAKIIPMGSAGYKVSAVVRGEADAYLHSGGQFEWDSAAPVAVALAAGLHASRIDGTPLVYNQENPYLPDLMVCRPEIAERLLREVAAVQKSGADLGGISRPVGVGK